MKTQKLTKEEVKKYRDLIEELKTDKVNSFYFYYPVSKKEVPTYRDVIKHPMDFSTIEKKLRNFKYSSQKEVQEDLQLIWDNCKLFNMEGSEIYRSAEIMENKTQELLVSMFKPKKKIVKKLLEEDGSDNMLVDNTINAPSLLAQSQVLSSNVNSLSNANSNVFGNKSEFISSNSKEVLQSEVPSCNGNTLCNAYQDARTYGSEHDSPNNNDEGPEQGEELSLSDKIKLSDQIRQMDNESINQFVRIIFENKKEAVMDHGEKLDIRLDIIDKATYNKITEYFILLLLLFVDSSVSSSEIRTTLPILGIT